MLRLTVFKFQIHFRCFCKFIYAFMATPRVIFKLTELFELHET